MHLHLDPLPLLAVCPNPAWQQILVFPHLFPGDVNRAVSRYECGGGKGVNVARVWRQLGYPSAVAVFRGGATGCQLLDELQSAGTTVLAAMTASQTRTCITAISEDNQQVTELIGPAERVNCQEVAELQEKIKLTIKKFGAVALSGTTPPGVNDDFYAKIATVANENKIPVVLDAVQEVEKTLRVGVTLLKINHAELIRLTGCADIIQGAQLLLRQYPKLSALAITAGAEPAWLFVNGEIWRLNMPKLPEPISNVIGAGDCATAIITRRLAETDCLQKLPNFFREAMACASASCLKIIPAEFDQKVAIKLMESMKLQQVN